MATPPIYNEEYRDVRILCVRVIPDKKTRGTKDERIMKEEKDG